MAPLATLPAPLGGGTCDDVLLQMVVEDEESFSSACSSVARQYRAGQRAGPPTWVSTVLGRRMRGQPTPLERASIADLVIATDCCGIWAKVRELLLGDRALLTAVLWLLCACAEHGAVRRDMAHELLCATPRPWNERKVHQALDALFSFVPSLRLDFQADFRASLDEEHGCACRRFLA